MARPTQVHKHAAPQSVHRHILEEAQSFVMVYQVLHSSVRACHVLEDCCIHTAWDSRFLQDSCSLL